MHLRISLSHLISYTFSHLPCVSHAVLFNHNHISLFLPLTFNTFLSFSSTTFANRNFSFFLWVCHRHRVTCLACRRVIIAPTSKLGCIYRYETQPTFAPTMEQTSNQLLTKDSRHRSLAIEVCKVSLYIYLHKDR